MNVKLVYIWKLLHLKMTQGTEPGGVQLMLIRILFCGSLFIIGEFCKSQGFRNVHRKMKELAASSVKQVYSVKWTKEKLKTKHGGRSKIWLIVKCYADEKANVYVKMEWLITISSKLILSDSCQYKYDKSSYPTATEMRPVNLYLSKMYSNIDGNVSLNSIETS